MINSHGQSIVMAETSDEFRKGFIFATRAIADMGSSKIYPTKEDFLKQLHDILTLHELGAFFPMQDRIKNLMSRKDKYILDENNNAIPATLLEWGEFLEYQTDRKIVKQEEKDNHRISTVFLGLDHGLREFHERNENYKPLIFETMIFKNGTDIYCTRYSTWKEAEQGHEVALQWVKDGCKEEDELDDI